MPQPTKGLSLTEILLALNDGGAAEELATEIRSATIATEQTAKKSSVTLKIDIAPNGRGAVKITDKITVSLPKPDPVETMFYVADDGGLTRRDPRQPSLMEEVK